MIEESMDDRLLHDRDPLYQAAVEMAVRGNADDYRILVRTMELNDLECLDWCNRHGLKARFAGMFWFVQQRFFPVAYGRGESLLEAVTDLKRKTRHADN